MECPYLRTAETAFLEAATRSPNYPADGQLTLVTEHADAAAVLRSQDFKPTLFTDDGTNPVMVDVDHAGVVRTVPPEERTGSEVDWVDLTVGKTSVISLHGVEHRTLRRALQPLFARSSHEWYRTQAVGPAIRRRLATLVAQGEGPDVGFDVVAFSHRLYLDLAALLIGLDDCEDEVRLSELKGIYDRMAVGRPARPNDLRVDDDLTKALDASRTFRSNYLVPALARRRELVAQLDAGSISQDELPRDFLTLAARTPGLMANDEELFKQAVFMFNAAISTTTTAFVHMVENVLVWIKEHPQDATRVEDDDFLGRALRESIRLIDPGVRVIARRSLADVILPSGLNIGEGEYVAVFLYSANRDESAFGASADRFDPDREISKGAQPYGFGFGAGAHMCLAVPIVLGEGGVSGTVVPAVAALLRAGLRHDQKQQVRYTDTAPLFEEISFLPAIASREGLKDACN